MTELTRVKVLEAYTRDVGKNIARIDSKIMESIGASPGEAMEIHGTHRTVAKCLPLFSSDEGKNIIRIDGLMRENAKVSVGDTVTIRRVDALFTESLVLALIGGSPQLDEHYVAEALNSMVVTNGDMVMIPYFGGRLFFVVLETQPAGEANAVGIKTQMEILPSLTQI